MAYSPMSSVRISRQPSQEGLHWVCEILTKETGQEAGSLEEPESVHILHGISVANPHAVRKSDPPKDGQVGSFSTDDQVDALAARQRGFGSFVDGLGSDACI